MNPAPLTIDIVGMDRAEATLQAIRSTLANRRALHAEIAVNALDLTRQYLLATPRHKTAERLGATPTNFRSKNATQLSATSDDQAAILRIPRSTGLGRAFGEVTIRPLGGRKFLTVPAHRETYGRQAGEFPEDTFDFAIILTQCGPAPVFLWAASAGGHQKGEVAFWLRRMVVQKQDRTLLPSDDAYLEIGRRTSIEHIRRLIAADRTGGGPYGGTSTGMPSV